MCRGLYGGCVCGVGVGVCASAWGFGFLRLVGGPSHQRAEARAGVVGVGQEVYGEIGDGEG